MKKLMISFLIILMFAFSLNKYNSTEAKRLIEKYKYIGRRSCKPGCVCKRSPCPCCRFNPPFFKPSNSTKTNKQE